MDRRKKWSDEFVQRASELWKSGMDVRDIATALGISRNVFFKITYTRRHLFPYRCAPWTSTDEAELMRLYREEVPAAEIATRMNRPRSLIYGILDRVKTGIVRRKRGKKRGEYSNWDNVIPCGPGLTVALVADQTREELLRPCPFEFNDPVMVSVRKQRQKLGLPVSVPGDGRCGGD